MYFIQEHLDVPTHLLRSVVLAVDPAFQPTLVPPAPASDASLKVNLLWHRLLMPPQGTRPHP